MSKTIYDNPSSVKPPNMETAAMKHMKQSSVSVPRQRGNSLQEMEMEIIQESAALPLQKQEQHLNDEEEEAQETLRERSSQKQLLHKSSSKA